MSLWTSGWGRRWLVAGALAAAIAMWPACSAPSGTSTPGRGGEVAKLDFVLKDMNGATVNLADFKGRPLILNFWATWCGPCKIEIPSFVALADQYKDQRLAILGISVDDSPEDLRKFAADFKMNYPVLVGLGHDDIQEQYEAMMMIPITWFIRPDGTVHLKHSGPATKDWFEAQVKALLMPTERP
jgi:peroxiredoxin